MPNDIEITDTKVFTVYRWFQAEMRSIGRNVKLPKCRDLTKTYQFRWVKSFTQKCYQEWDLNDRIVGILIKDVVNYANRQKILNKGTQILTMSNVIDICYQGLKELSDDEASLINELDSCHQFLIGQANDKNNLVRRLVESDTGGCSNLLYWYNQGRLTEVYVALSKSCNEALTKLPAIEREEFPSSFELFRICTHTVSNELLPKLKPVMGTDLRTPPTALNK